MVGIYLSGTGNTKHCITKLLSAIDERAEAYPIESDSAIARIKENDTVIMAYPTQFSNVPYMVRDFIERNGDLWEGKKIFCVVTMGAFSGDGAGCSARILRKHGAIILGGLHIKMPDAVCDNKMLKRPLEENRRIVKEADKKIESVAAEIRNDNKYPQDGLSFAARLVGLFGQRLWFYNKTANYSHKLKISDDCIGCGICSSNCPMGNISITDGKAVPGDRCAMCYRCISHCPCTAITLLGNKVYEQCTYEKYTE